MQCLLKEMIELIMESSRVNNGARVMQMDKLPQQTKSLRRQRNLNREIYSLHEAKLDKSDHRKLIEDGSPGCGSGNFQVPISNRVGNSGVTNDTVTISDTTTTTTASSSAFPPPPGMIPFFPGCFPSDSITQEFTIGIALDYGYFQELGSNTANALLDMESMMANTRLLYLQQLNVLLNVGKVVIGNFHSPFPLNMSVTDGTCSTNYQLVLDGFADWNANTNDGVPGNEMGLWPSFNHLLAITRNCWTFKYRSPL